MSSTARAILANHLKVKGSFLVNNLSFRVWYGISEGLLCPFLCPRGSSWEKDLRKFINSIVTGHLLDRLLISLQFASTVIPLLKFLNFFPNLTRDTLCISVPSLQCTLSRYLSPNALVSLVPFHLPAVPWEVYNDVSLVDWGIHTSKGLRLQGTWFHPLKQCRINKTLFQWIHNLGLIPEVNLGTSRENTQLPSYVSPVLDLRQLQWIPFLWIVPPMSQFLEVVSILKGFWGTGFLVTLEWPSQRWYCPQIQFCLSGTKKRFVIQILICTSTIFPGFYAVYIFLLVSYTYCQNFSHISQVFYV